MSLATPLSRALLAAALLVPSAEAQLCPQPSDNFWKNDTLPAVPSGSFSWAPVLGLGEGEAAAAVFTLADGQSAQTVKRVAIGFGSAFGIPGNQAVLDIEIYDGVTFSGGLPILGPKVFDLGDDTGGSIQVTTDSISTYDLPAVLRPTVGATTGNFVVAFRLDFNSDPLGLSNLTCDANPVSPCSPQGKNLIDIAGQGWRDATLAQVSGQNLCPNFYSGNWVIRACTEGADPTVCQPDLGFQGPGTATLSICGDPLTPTGTADILLEDAPIGAPAFLFYGLFNNPLPILGGQLVPFPWNGIEVFPVDVNGEVLVPGVGSGAGPISLYLQFVVVDGTQPQGYQFSNAVRMDFLP